MSSGLFKPGKQQIHAALGWRHTCGFEASSAALEYPYTIEENDLDCEGEQRLRTVGMANGEVIVLIIRTIRDAASELDQIARIIHARRASSGERRDYEQHRATSGWHSIE